MRRDRLDHRFVEFIPDSLEEGVLYVSLEYRTVAHKCCCGCGSEVVTPLGPTDWRITYDGVSVSLDPSVGSWSLPCQSHYWVKNNQVRWAGSWTKQQIQVAREGDALAKRRYFAERSDFREQAEASAAKPAEPPAVSPRPASGWWGRIKAFFRAP